VINADLMDLYRVNLGRVIGACMLLLVLAGCNSIKPQNEVSEPLPTQTVSDVSAVSDSTGTEPKRIPKFNEYPVAPFKNDALYQLLVAEVAGYRGEYEIALEKYMEMATETQDAGVAARATRLANYLKRNDLALQASQIWSEVDPDSIEAHRHAADQLVRSGDLEQAILHMEAIKNLGGLANFDVFAYRAANLEPQEREALLVGISRMLETDPDDEQLLFSKAVLLEQQGELEAALAIAEQLLGTKNNINVVILKVNALKALLRSDEALAFLADVVDGFEEENRRLRLIYARFLFEAGDLDVAKVQYGIILEQAPSDGDILFALALIAMEQKQDEEAVTYLNKMVRWNRRIGEAHFYIGTIAEKNNDIAKALREYKQVGRGYEFLPAQSRIASIFLDQGRIADMQHHLANMRADNPDRKDELVMVEAQLLGDHGIVDEVFYLLDKEVVLQPDNLDMRYFRAMTAQRHGRMEQMERDLLYIIEKEPLNADALNALGYTLADQTDRYEEALGMIERALVIKPDEAAFIDSMGWVQYRLKNYSEAIRHLRRALELFTNDEVAAHLGEVLWVSGSKDEAIKVWRKALQLAPQSEILQKVMEEFAAQ
jgi:tetratricopeptide (TPR) repeat protein